MVTWKEHLKSWRIDMTREDLINAMPIIKAFIDGKKLQYKDLNHEWEDLEVNDLDLDDFVESAWRIKSEPKYRPFANVEECWTEMKKHQPFGWVKTIGVRTHFAECKSIGELVLVGLESTPHTYKYAFDTYTFADGTTFGVKVEE